MNNWKDLLLICAFMLVFAIVFQSIPPVVGILVTSLGITHTQAGALMSLFGLPGIFISIPGGILADSYGSKKVGLFSLGITLLGSLIVALASNFTALLTGRVVAGIGALTISVVAPQTLSQRYGKEDLGKVMGIFNSMVPLGTVLTLNLFGRLATTTSWRVPLFLASAYTLVVLLFFKFKYDDLPSETEQTERPKVGESLAYLKEITTPVWLLGVIWLVYNAGTIAYLSFASDYYVTIGYDLSYAGFLSSLLMIGALILSPIVGILIDHYGNEEVFIITGSLGIALLFWLIPQTIINPVVLGLLLGVAAACVPAPLFALLPKYLPPQRLGLGYGILATLLNIGVLVGPFFVGHYYDLTASYLQGFNLMTLFLLLAGILAIFLFVINKGESRSQTKRKVKR